MFYVLTSRKFSLKIKIIFITILQPLKNMKIFIKFLVLISLALTSCSKENEEYFSYTFSENKQLNIETYDESYMKFSNIVEGTNLVFEYEYSAEDKVDISDDEYSEFIRFEINPTLTEFTYKNAELSDIKTVFTKKCFCGFMYELNKDEAPIGTISGLKISQTEWTISIDVTFYGDEHRSLMNNFQMKN
jgi:hypothetical protein